MILGIGTDIIEVERIKKAVDRESFKMRVFTAREADYAEGKKKQKYESYAGRFAGKEAVLKALGTGLRYGKLQDIEIISDEYGKPVVELLGIFKDIATEKGVNKMHISISHTRDYAVAHCIMEG